MVTHAHLLKELRLPSRFESLIGEVGPEVAQLLVEPAKDTLGVFEEAALHMKARGRGLFLPINARSGTGKTTLVSNLPTWLPNEYATTARIAGGEVSAQRLRQAVEAAGQEAQLPADDERIVVVNVDDRESDPPTDRELSQIKGFLREEGTGSRTVVVWPETSQEHAVGMARSYEDRAGTSPVSIPVQVDGPVPEEWQGLAIETLKLVNGLASLEELGVNPRDYEPRNFKTIGDFLDKISADFVTLLAELIRSTKKPIQVVIVFISESGGVGALSELTGSARYGFLDADRLLSATPNSVIGRWWSKRSGLLVQTIVRLDARGVFIAPSLAIPIIRRYGPEEAVTTVKEFKARAPSDISVYFNRSDFGRLLLRQDSATSEGRGNPAREARAGFARLASEYGFGSGHDKQLNRAVGDFLTATQEDLGEVVVEKRLPPLPLIPDIAIDSPDEAKCIEMHWRSGDFLTTTNRSDLAQYILKKLKAYAVSSGWVTD